MSIQAGSRRKPDSELNAVLQCVALRVRRFARVVTDHYDLALSDIGLTASQFSLASAIALEQPISQADLANILGLEKSSVSRSLRPLLAGKYVSRKGPSEGRHLLSVTPKGWNTLQVGIEAWKKAHAEVLVATREDIALQLDAMTAHMARCTESISRSALSG